MKKIISLIVFNFLMILNIHASEMYVLKDILLKEYSQEQRQKGLKAASTGHSTPGQKIRYLSMDFQCDKCASVEEVRRIFINCIESMVTRMNANKKIRPYLKFFPCDRRNVDTIISFRDIDGKYPKMPSVAFVSKINKDNDTFIFYKGYDHATKEYVLLLKESYIEALEKVRNCD